MARGEEARKAIERYLGRVRRQTEHELEALAADLLGIAGLDPETRRVSLERAAADIARAIARGGDRARRDAIAGILSVMRRMDAVASLHGILEVLANGCTPDTDHVVVLLVSGSLLRVFKHSGFALDALPADVSTDDVPVLAAALRLGQPVAVTRGIVNELPAFMRPVRNRAGVVIPVVVGREAVAVVYADGHATSPAEPLTTSWAERIEVLVRHAGVRLESVTSQRTVAVLSLPS